jgi:hypothetical protein
MGFLWNFGGRPQSASVYFWCFAYIWHICYVVAFLPVYDRLGWRDLITNIFAVKKNIKMKNIHLSMGIQ